MSDPSCVSSVHTLAGGKCLTEQERREGLYWACEQPERTHTDKTCYDLACEACVLAALAAVRNGQGHSLGTDPDMDDGKTMTLDAWVEKVIQKKEAE